MANKSDKKRRRKQNQFKAKTVRTFSQNMVKQADLWEQQGLTAEQIIADIRRQATDLGLLLQRIGTN